MGINTKPSSISIKDVDLEELARVIREEGRPVRVNRLAQAAVRAWLEAGARVRLYAPGAQYAEGETIRFKGQSATVKSVRTGSNPKQGQFKVLTLVLSDGTEQYMAGGVAEAPAQDRESISEQRVRAIVDGEDGLVIRAVVQEALDADARFVWFQDAQGDHWCLAEMLPGVMDEYLAQIWSMLQGLFEENTIYPQPTEGLVKAVWEQENDGSDAYVLKAFALNTALQRCREVRWLGDGWVLEEEWQRLQERPALVGPREENVVVPPTGVVLDTEDGEEEEEEAGAEKPTIVIEEDFDGWQLNRRLNATITLRARPYYGNWLPLTKDMRRVFPPYASESYSVTFYHWFGGEEELFQAWVDWNQRRILGSPKMYQAFYEHGIYPGARLVISHRGNMWEYDIRTKPIEGEQRVRVRRVFLSDDEELEFDEVDEPVRYEVDDDVFIADARWEDLEALFRQADEVGAGIFQLMYERCCEWWEEGGRQPLHVTAQQLFKAVHHDDKGRLTSKATIAWELWRRLAFEPAGGGRHLFRPEKADWVRSLGPRGRALKPRAVRPGPKVHKDISLAVLQPATEMDEERLEAEEPLWEKVAKLIGQELHTLARKRPFRILDVADQSLDILVGSTGQQRTIRRREIGDAWQHLTAQRELSRIEIRDRYSEANPAYIAAILAALPGVAHRTKPIRLFYGQEAEPEAAPEKPLTEETPEAPAVERRRDGQLVATELVPPGPLFAEAPEAPEAVSEGRPSAPPTEPAEPPTAEEVSVSEPAPEEPTPPPPEPPAPSLPSTSPSPPPASPPAPRPRGGGAKLLFSDHYLHHHIAEHPEWGEDVAEPLARLQALYEHHKADLPQMNEAQTEKEFIRPALELLGFAYIPQPPTRRAGRVQRPDYALFADEAAKSEAYTHQQDEAAFYSRALAIADAKYWGRPLSKARPDDPRDEFKNTNPSFQIVNYLIGTNVDWGMLTNGQTWRLYYRQASSTATEFYEVDLIELLESGDLEQFKYFWLFFRRQAFVKDPQGQNFLERVREGSATYARVIGDRLKALVFEEVFPLLAGGFVLWLMALPVAKT